MTEVAFENGRAEKFDDLGIFGKVLLLFNTAEDPVTRKKCLSHSIYYFSVKL